MNSKMVYAEAMEKTVSGFREIHKTRRINLHSTDQEWDEVYSDFMKKNGLPL